MAATDGPHAGWYSSTIRPLRVIARLLERAGIPERLYTEAAGGNEGTVYLIRPEADAVVSLGLVPVPLR